VALARPAVAARLNTRDTATLLRSVAEKVGGGAADACSWTSSESITLAELDRLFAARRGGPFSDAYETAWLGELEHGGWWVSTAGTREAFSQVALEAGGWADPYFAPGGIRETLKARGGVSWPVGRLVHAAGTASGDAPPAGVARPHAAPDEKFPLRLVAFTPATVALVGGANNPSLFELLGQPEGKPWRVWAELSPETAAELGIDAESEIRLTAPSGHSLDAVALIVDGMMHGAVAVAFVPESPAGGRWARFVRADVRTLLGGGNRGDRFVVRVAKA
jgi:anaerobic selenocysteine-containing dehydrogenase